MYVSDHLYRAFSEFHKGAVIRLSSRDVETRLKMSWNVSWDICGGKVLISNGRLFGEEGPIHRMDRCERIAVRVRGTNMDYWGAGACLCVKGESCGHCMQVKEIFELKFLHMMKKPMIKLYRPTNKLCRSVHATKGCYKHSLWNRIWWLIGSNGLQ